MPSKPCALIVLLLLSLSVASAQEALITAKEIFSKDEPVVAVLRVANPTGKAQDVQILYWVESKSGEVMKRGILLASVEGEYKDFRLQISGLDAGSYVLKAQVSDSSGARLYETEFSVGRASAPPIQIPSTSPILIAILALAIFGAGIVIFLAMPRFRGSKRAEEAEEEEEAEEPYVPPPPETSSGVTGVASAQFGDKWMDLKLKHGDMDISIRVESIREGDYIYRVECGEMKSESSLSIKLPPNVPPSSILPLIGAIATVISLSPGEEKAVERREELSSLQRRLEELEGRAGYSEEE